MECHHIFHQDDNLYCQANIYLHKNDKVIYINVTKKIIVWKLYGKKMVTTVFKRLKTGNLH